MSLYVDTSALLKLYIVDLDADLCLAAAQIAERTGARTLDALHLAAASISHTRTMVTYDRRLAQAAHDEGLEVAHPGQTDDA